MSSRIPALLIVPHGGTEIPDELYGYENVSPADIFFDSDAGANGIFIPGRTVEPPVYTVISRLFMDTDREYSSVHPVSTDGVIKTRTSMDKEVFKNNCYPDEIAISNILARYYFPFHEQIGESIKRNRVKIIIECHTHAAVGPINSPDPGMPRPLVITRYTTGSSAGVMKTATPGMAMELATILGRMLQSEGDTISDKFRVSQHNDRGGCLMRLYGNTVPMISLSVSRSLFLTDRFFDLDKLTIDTSRMERIGEIIFSGIEKFCKKFL